MTDQPPTVVNPQAVGDPNQTPIVRLWPASQPTDLDDSVVPVEAPEAHSGAQGARPCSLCHVPIATGSCTHAKVDAESVTMSRTAWERQVAELNRLRTLAGRLEDGDLAAVDAYQRQEGELAQARADVERLTRERDEANTRSFEIAEAAGDRLNEIEKLHRANRAQALAIEVVGEKLNEVRATALELAAERDWLADTVRRVREATAEWCKVTNDLNVHTLAAEIDSILGDGAPAVDPIETGTEAALGEAEEKLRRQQPVIDAAKAYAARLAALDGGPVSADGAALLAAVDALGDAGQDEGPTP